MDKKLQELKIKDSWDRVTISDFMMIEEINQDANLNSLEKMIKILSVLSGVNDSFFNKFLVTDLTQLFEKVDFLKTPPNAQLKDFYVIGGKKYKFIKRYADLSTGQHIDLDHFTKDRTGIIDNLHTICAIFLLPVVEKKLLQRAVEKLGLKKYRNTENYMETPLQETSENIFNHMLYGDANAISLFFCVVGQLYTANIRDYLAQMTKSQLQEASTKLSKVSTNNKKIESSLQRAKDKIAILQSGVGSYV
jgi:hypothetical protein